MNSLSGGTRYAGDMVEVAYQSRWSYFGYGVERLPARRNAVFHYFFAIRLRAD